MGAPLRVVAPENLHVTLKFLGEIREDQVHEVTQAMDRALKGFTSFEARLRGLGAFPGMGYIRVIWVGIVNEELVKMQRALDAELAKLGFPREKKFHPHLTLARVKSRRGLDRVRGYLAEHADKDYGEALVDRVELKKSVLTPRGPIYSSLFLRRL